MGHLALGGSFSCFKFAGDICSFDCCGFAVGAFVSSDSCGFCYNCWRFVSSDCCGFCKALAVDLQPFNGFPKRESRYSLLMGLFK